MLSVYLSNAYRNLMFFCCRSSECRVVTRHSSVTDVSTKRREIVVPAKAKQKENDKKKKAKLQRSISAIGLSYK